MPLCEDRSFAAYGSLLAGQGGCPPPCLSFRIGANTAVKVLVLCVFVGVRAYPSPPTGSSCAWDQQKGGRSSCVGPTRPNTCERGQAGGRVSGRIKYTCTWPEQENLENT
jgi:hypothetical protein